VKKTYVRRPAMPISLLELSERQIVI